MGGLSRMYSMLMTGAIIICLINLVAAYPGLNTKEKDFVQESDASLSDDKDGSEQDLRKRIFDPIEAASNFGSFGKRYNPYRVIGYNGGMDNGKSLDRADIADILKKVLAMAVARQGGYKKKRQFDPIGYGMFARFG